MKEQSTHYAAYIATIHLVAIRICMLKSAKQSSGALGISEMRSSLSHNLWDINYATRLWQVFKAIITGALNELKGLLGEAVILVMETIEPHINCFFVQALQLGSKTLQLETQ